MGWLGTCGFGAGISAMSRILLSLKVSVLVIFALAAWSGLAKGEDQVVKDRSVEQLIQMLGSPIFKEREAATRKLRSLGEPALPALIEAQKTSDLEVSRRAQRLIDAILDLSDLATSCYGKPVSTAAASNPRKRCHPMAIFFSTGELHESWQEYL